MKKSKRSAQKFLRHMANGAKIFAPYGSGTGMPVPFNISLHGAISNLSAQYEHRTGNLWVLAENIIHSFFILLLLLLLLSDVTRSLSLRGA